MLHCHNGDCSKREFQSQFSRAFTRARQCDLSEAANQPTLTGTAGAHAHRRRLHGEYSPRLTTGNGQGSEQLIASYPHPIAQPQSDLWVQCPNHVSVRGDSLG